MNTNSYLDGENENFRQGMRTVQEAWTTMFTRLTEENGNLSKSIEELRRDNGGLQRRLQTSEREALEFRQQIATLGRQLEELGNHNKILSAQVQKWKTMTQTFQRMFTESGVDDDIPPVSFAGNAFKNFQEPSGNSFLSASPAPASIENTRSFANFGVAAASSPVREVDTKSFLAAVKERLAPSDAKAVVDLVKTLRFASKDEVMNKARLFLQDDDLLGHLALICDRTCVAN
jgi:hypothetical protein